MRHDGDTTYRQWEETVLPVTRNVSFKYDYGGRVSNCVFNKCSTSRTPGTVKELRVPQ